MKTEDLYIHVYLWEVGILTEDEYNNYLDRIFLENPENNLLIELEMYSYSLNESLAVLNRYSLRSNSDFDIKKFGRKLFAELKKFYMKNNTDIYDFTNKCWLLWCAFPECMDKEKYEDYFYWLNSVDDMIDYAYEGDVRKKIEEMLDFFEEQENKK